MQRWLHFSKRSAANFVDPNPKGSAQQHLPYPSMAFESHLIFFSEEYEASRAELLKRQRAMEELKKLKTELQPRQRELQTSVEALSNRLVEVEDDLEASRDRAKKLEQEIHEEERFRSRYEKGGGGLADPVVMENHLQGVSRTDLASIKALKKPPEIVQNVLTAVFCMLANTKKKPQWDSIDSGREGVRQLISKNDFISRLFGFQARSQPHATFCVAGHKCCKTHSADRAGGRRGSGSVSEPPEQIFQAGRPRCRHRQGRQGEQSGRTHCTMGE